MGQQSILHAVKVHRSSKTERNFNKKTSLDAPVEEDPATDDIATKPLSQTLVDLQLEAGERENIAEDRKLPAISPILKYAHYKADTEF